MTPLDTSVTASQKNHLLSGGVTFSTFLVNSLLACVPVLRYTQGSLANSSDGIATPLNSQEGYTRSYKTFACFFASTRLKNTSNSSMEVLCEADFGQVAISSFEAIVATLHSTYHHFLIATGIWLGLTNLSREQAMNTPYIRDTPPKNRFHLQNSIISLIGIIAALQTLSTTKQDFQDNFIVLTNLFQAAHELLTQLERQVGCLPEFVTGEA